MNRRLIAPVVAAVCGLHAPCAAAEPKVVELRAPKTPKGASEEAARRLEGELAAAGFVVSAPDDASRPFARVTLAGDDTTVTVEVWSPDPAHPSVMRRRVVREAATAGGVAVLAIRAVELLRASLAPAAIGGAAAPGVTASAAPASGADGPRAAPVPGDAFRSDQGRGVWLSLGAGPAVLWGTRGLGLAFASRARVGVEDASGWGAGVSYAGPSFGAALEAPAGQARVRQEFGLAEFSYRLPWPSPRASLIPSAGFGAYHVAVSGTGVGRYVGENEGVWAALAAAGAGLDVRLGRQVGILFEGQAVLTQPGVRVDIADAVVGAAGRPSLVISATVVGRFCLSSICEP